MQWLLLVALLVIVITTAYVLQMSGRDYGFPDSEERFANMAKPSDEVMLDPQGSVKQAAFGQGLLLADVLQVLVDSLPPRQKTALMLRVYEDLSFREIAEIMQCPYDTAKANYRHALMKLKIELEENQELKKWTEEVGGFVMDMTRRAAEAE